MKIKINAGKKYSICSSGLSDSLPYCYNKHREVNSEHGTDYKSVKITPENDTAIIVNSSRWIKTEENK